MTKHDHDVALSVTNVSKTFKLPHERHGGIKNAVVGVVGGRHKRGYERQRVLQDISFDVKKGEFFGIVGRNGSGKSTLLKLMSGIYTPDSGKISVDGTIMPFIELGVGFNPELTGLENVYLNGALLGYSRKEMESKYEEIVRFAELEDFMDQKLKNYSSGMQVRLAFSIAIQAESDILILDEVLAVGDESFQRKCFKYFSDIKQRKKTVILVTHSMESVQQFCDRAMLIENGAIVDIGEPASITQQYSDLFITKTETNEKGEEEKKIAQNDSFEIDANVDKVDKTIELSISVKPKKKFSNAVVGAYISRDNGEIVWSWASDYKTEANKNTRLVLEEGKTTEIRIALENILPSARFFVTVLVRKNDRSEQYAKYSNVVQFDNFSSNQYEKYWKIKETIEISHGG